jgi:membrane-bound ClpP family serine protease
MKKLRIQRIIGGITYAGVTIGVMIMIVALFWRFNIDNMYLVFLLIFIGLILLVIKWRLEKKK